jgi:hypothetical protein
MEDYLNRRKAAEYASQRLGRPVTRDLLAKWASRGVGPVYHLIFNQASYRRSDIDAWIESIRRVPTRALPEAEPEPAKTKSDTGRAPEVATSGRQKARKSTP